MKLIRVDDEIFDKEKVTFVTRDGYDVILHFSSEQSLTFGGEEAEKVWEEFASTAEDIFDSNREAVVSV